MGYYKKADLPFYLNLVQKFTVCDNYFCSVLGPTHPNRLMADDRIDRSGWCGRRPDTGDQLGPEAVPMDVFVGDHARGSAGQRHQLEGVQPLRLELRPRRRRPSSARTCCCTSSSTSDPTSPLYQNAFNYYGPNVVGGLTGGSGPTTSPPTGQRHPPSGVVDPSSRQRTTSTHRPLRPWVSGTRSRFSNTLLSNPEVWASTVLFIMYDENDGLFDHVAPPTPPAGTRRGIPDRRPTTLGRGGQAGPIGFGVRVPMMVVSPFSTGGNVCSDVFDHTSQLRFLETLFGVFGTQHLRLAAPDRGRSHDGLPKRTPVTKTPRLPLTSDSTTTAPVGPLSANGGPDGECTALELVGADQAVTPFAIGKHQKMPSQAKGSLNRI